MVVICEECGKVYKLDAEKLKKSMKGKTSKIKCKVCDHVIQVSLPEDAEEAVAAGNIQQVSMGFTEAETPQEETGIVDNDTFQDEEDEEEIPIPEPAPKKETPKPKQKQAKKKGSGIGLRAKMFFLFLLIPVALMASSSVFTQFQMLDLAKNITDKSTGVVKQLAEQSIIDKARSVASQCSIFLKNNPDLNKDDFYYNFDLKGIAIQKVGTKGYTALVEVPETDEGDDQFIIWSHPNPDFIGVPLLPTYKPFLGSSYNKYLELVNALRIGKGSSGYYTWKDEKNMVKDRFVAIEPIEQTPYSILSSTYIEDFTGPITTLEQEAKKLTEQTRNITIAILGAILLLIFLFIAVYGYRLTNNIGKLTDAADRISVGELDVQIDIRSNDEIGALADAISRMQDSLRFSIERLRRRR